MDIDNISSKTIKIDYATVEWLKKVALHHLGLTNINKLRDRFEGQLYLDIFLQRSYMEIAFEKYLGTSIIDRQKKELHKNYIPNIIVNGKLVLLIPYGNGEYPKVPNKLFDCAIFGLVNRETRQVEITGFLDKLELSKHLDTSSLSPMNSKGYLGVFKNFSVISPIAGLNL